MTTGRGFGSSEAAGGPARHIPVLRVEALGALHLAPGGRYLDGTFGAGGYTRAMLEAFPDIEVLALDRDPTAIAAAAGMLTEFKGRLTLVEAQFSDLERVAAETGFAPLCGIVLDIGVSSMQIDEAERGFSFRHDGPLDMRMGAHGPSATDIVNDATEERLADIFYHYGEERLARPVARAIVAARKDARIETTRQLAEVVAKVVYAKPHEIHPATRTFQGLRIAVNDELGELVQALHGAERVLRPGGYLAVVTFHSLEDRIVKQFFAARAGRGGGSRHAPLQVTAPPTFRLEGKWPVVPGDAECRENPRARSAKLRAAQRTEHAAQPLDAGIAGLAALPEIKRGRRG